MEQANINYSVSYRNIKYARLEFRSGQLQLILPFGLSPEEIISKHETAHLIERNHNRRFWQLITAKYPSYKQLKQQLFAYWFLVQDNKELPVT